MSESLTPSMEDYLKVIYILTNQSGRASTKQISDKMGVAPSSATGMLQKMASESSPPLVDYQKHYGVILTPAGESAALEIIRRHRLLELFLQKALGYTWDEVHEEADRLEHVISAEFTERIAQSMGDPLSDPHGEPIPSREYALPVQSNKRLLELTPGQTGRIQRVEDSRPELLRYLAGLGLVPGVDVRIISFSVFDGNLEILVSGQSNPVILGSKVTNNVFVD